MNIPGRKYFYDEVVYSDWFPRQGDDMILRVELIDQSSSGTSLDVDVAVFTKNTEDTGDGAAVTAASPSINSVTMEAVSSPADQAALIKTIYVQSDANGLKELVRVKCSASNGNAGDWLELRIHAPIFFNGAEVT
jgi:hypothetical protein